MKKLSLLLLLVIAAAVPVAPYFIGTVVEKNFRIAHEELAAQAALSGFEVELIDYQRQHFYATAITRINMAVPHDREMVSFDLSHHIDHIPQPTSQVVATVDSELVLSEEAREVLASLFRGQAPLTINTRIFIDGHQEATINSPAASGELAGKAALAVEWQGLQGTAWQAAGRERLSFTVNIPGVALGGAGASPQALHDSEASIMAASVDADAGASPPRQPLESMGIRELHYAADMHRGESGMWHGKANGSIAAIDIDATGVAGEAVVMHAEGIDMHGEQDESNGLMNASGVVKSSRININGFDLTNATYDAALENLDVRSFRAWQHTVAKMMKNNMRTDNPFAPLIEHLPALVNAHPVIRINDISVDSPMGRFAIKMNSRIIGQWNDMLLKNPAMLATMITADLEASLPRTVVASALQDTARKAIRAQNAAKDSEMSQDEVEQAVTANVNQQLAGLIGQGFIKEKDAQLEARVEYNAGRLTVNGMDASPLMGAMAR